MIVINKTSHANGLRKMIMKKKIINIQMTEQLTMKRAKERTICTVIGLTAGLNVS